MKMQGDNLKDQETKIRSLEDTLDQLNEDIASLRAKGKERSWTE